MSWCVRKTLCTPAGPSERGTGARAPKQVYSLVQNLTCECHCKSIYCKRLAYWCRKCAIMKTKERCATERLSVCRQTGEVVRTCAPSQVLRKDRCEAESKKRERARLKRQVYPSGHRIPFGRREAGARDPRRLINDDSDEDGQDDSYQQSFANTPALMLVLMLLLLLLLLNSLQLFNLVSHPLDQQQCTNCHCTCPSEQERLR